MTDEEKVKLLMLLDSMSKKLTSIEQKADILDREILRMANYILKLEARIRELESNSDV